MRRQFYLLGLIAALLIGAPHALAQSNVVGTAIGTVQTVEQEGRRPLENVKVTIHSLHTEFTAECQTNARGEYVFENIRQSEYRISAELRDYVMVEAPALQSFKVPISVNGPTVVKFPLIEMRTASAPIVVPPVADKVTPPPPLPARGEQLVKLEGATRSQQFDERTMQALPLANNRSFDQLALLAAGVAPPPQAIGDTVGPGVGPGVGTSGQFAVNGLRSRANNFTVDGSDNNDEDIGVRRQGFTTLVPQAVESLQGFYVVTLLPHPAFGRNLGAQVTAISNGGDKEFHGMLYGFYTDRRLKARDAFDLTGGTDDILKRKDNQPVLLSEGGTRHPIPLPNPVNGESPFTRSQYGFTLGGPVARHNTFFFTSFERQDLNATKEANFAVPTVAERGVFGSGETGLVVQQGNQRFNVFPTASVSDAYFSLFPFPNNPRGPYGRNTYTEQLPAGADGSIASFKLDQQGLHAFGKEHAFTGRYNFTDDGTTLPVTGEALFSTLRAQTRTQNLSLFLISNPGGTTSNEFRFSYGRTRLGFNELRDPFLLPSRLSNEPDGKVKVPFLLNARKLSNATLPGDQQTVYIPRDPLFLTAESNTEPLGQVLVSGFSPLGTDVFNFPQRRVNNTFQAADKLSYNRGPHRLTGGADFRRVQLNSRLDRNFRPVAVFNGIVDIASRFGGKLLSSSGFFSGTDLLALGAATGFFQTQTLVDDSTIGLRQWQTNLFFADQLTVKRNFKLTLGLRYELNTVPEEVNRRIEAAFAPALVQRLITEEKRLYGVSGFERYLAGRQRIYRNDFNNLAPHIAFAWDPTGAGKTAVRGGYGIYYDQIPGAVISQSRNVFPRFVTLNLAGFGDQFTTTINPQRQAKPGTLNVYDPILRPALGRDLVEYFLNLNQLQINPSNNPITIAGPNYILPAADLVIPYAQHWSLATEREIAPDLLVSLAYVGSKGTHLLRLATPNLGANTFPVVNGGSVLGNTFFPTVFIVSPGINVAQDTNFRRPFPLFGGFTSIESDANSIYHSLQAEATLRLARGLQFSAAYTWSHAIDEASDLFALAGAHILPQDSFKRRGERGDANFDVRHRFVTSFIWELPGYASKKLYGGWQLAGILTLQTGQPFTVTSSIDVNLDGNLTDRLNTTSGWREVNNGSLRYEFPTAPDKQFALLAPAGTNGIVGRNTFRAPGIANLDLALNKLFRFTDRQQLEWRTEFFNLFNRTHFGIPVHELFFPGLGRAVNTTIPARTVQFAVRYRF